MGATTEARRGVLVVAGALTLVLGLLGGRYGFHRDELYFIEAGRHPAWGYPDQPPLVPLLARAWYDAVAGSLRAFRLVPAVLAGLIVIVGAATSRELGGRARDQVGTALVVAVSVVVVAIGHLFSTTTLDTLLTATVVWLVIRALLEGGRPGPGRWLVIGAVAGVALQVKTLPATVLLSIGIALLIVGPRRALGRPGPWLAAAPAAAIAAPNLLWQARNGWPQLELSRAIAAGSSGTSVDRWLVIPLQLTLTGPLLAVVLVTGLVALLRSPRLRATRWIGVAYLVLLLIVVATGGKPYYTLGLLPAVLAAGVPPVLDALTTRARRVLAAGLLCLHVALGAVIVLPLLPAAWLHRTPITDVNYDAGETVGWPRFVDTVATGAAGLDPPAGLILTANYGEAGALDRARRAGRDLPPVYSGHNGYGYWGPPPDTTGPVLLVGWFTQARADQLFAGCRIVARVDNGVGLENDEQGAPVRICERPRRPLAQLWPQIRVLS